MRFDRDSFVSLCLVAGALSGCVGDLNDDGLGVESSDIIGGSPITNDTRRSLGLVDVNFGCSGSLFDRDWVLTATHCIDLDHPANNSPGRRRRRWAGSIWLWLCAALLCSVLRSASPSRALRCCLLVLAA